MKSLETYPLGGVSYDAWKTTPPEGEPSTLTKAEVALSAKLVDYAHRTGLDFPAAVRLMRTTVGDVAFEVCCKKRAVIAFCASCGVYS